MYMNMYMHNCIYMYAYNKYTINYMAYIIGIQITCAYIFHNRGLFFDGTSVPSSNY